VPFLLGTLFFAVAVVWGLAKLQPTVKNYFGRP
jgi:hypothetical protein